MSRLTLLGVLLVGACAHEPELAGKSLLCDVDADCPADLRCYEGLCVQDSPCDTDADCTDGMRCSGETCQRNLLPVLSAVEEQAVRVEQPLSITVQARDPEGDPITITWTQASGPVALLSEPLVGDTLAVTPSELGRFAFAVEARDPYVPEQSVGGGNRIMVSIMVQPAAAAIYVSDDEAGSADDDCGSYGKPCATITLGLAHRRQSGGEVLVAASAVSGGYRECIHLQSGDVLLGCFDAATWTYEGQARAACRVVCDDLGGHSISGDGTVTSDLVLAMANGLTPVDPEVPIATVRIQGGSPHLTDVDLETAACGSSCLATGLLSVPGTSDTGEVPSSPVIERVEVTAGVDGFDPLEMFAGMTFLGGSAEVTGSPAVRAKDDGGRGGILMNAPVNSAAIGILALNANLTLTGITISGGLGPQLSGVESFGGELVASGNYVTLTSFGTRAMTGLFARICTSDGMCACNPKMQACAAPPSPAETYVPHAVFDNNKVELFAGSYTDGLVPCSGAGIGFEGSEGGSRAANNKVHIGDHFTLGLGITSTTDSAPPPASPVPNEVSRNFVDVGSSTVDPLCEFINQQAQSEFTAGALGLLLFRDARVSVLGNQVTVGSHERLAYGLWVLYGTEQKIERNTFTVAGAAAPEVPAADAVGAFLIADATASSGTFAANQVRLGSGARATTGLAIAGDVHWTVANNLLFGGRATQSTALTITTETPSVDWPKVVHNTIYAGGAGGMTSRAVLLYADDPDTPGSDSIGVFENNLLDGGEAQGRRFIFDNPGGSFVTTRAGNLAQWYGSIDGPQPVLAFTPNAAVNSGPSGEAAAWFALLPGAGEIAQLYADLSATPQSLEVSSVPVGGRPRYDAPVAAPPLPALHAWVSDSTTRQDVVVVLEDGRIATSVVESGEVREFEIFPTQSYAGGEASPHMPQLAVVAEATGEYPPDLVFIESESEAGAKDGGLWVMAGKREGGYATPVGASSVGLPLDALKNPTRLSVGPVLSKRNLLVLVDGLKLILSTKLVVDCGPAPHLCPLSSPTRIDAASIVSLEEESGLMVRQPDIIVIADGKPYVFWNPNLGTLTLPAVPWAAKSFASVPCSSAQGVVAHAVVEASALNTGKEIWFGCGDRSIALYRFNSGSSSYEKAAGVSATAADPTYYLAATALGASDSVLFVSQPASNKVDVYRLNAGTLSAAGTQEFYADVAMRTLDTGVPADTYASLGASPGITIPAASATCRLALRETGNTDPFDLHLAASDSVCVDHGVTLSSPLTDDIDGANTRTNTPDVGADEVR